MYHGQKNVRPHSVSERACESIDRRKEKPMTYILKPSINQAKVDLFSAIESIQA